MSIYIYSCKRFVFETWGLTTPGPTKRLLIYNLLLNVLPNEAWIQFDTRKVYYHTHYSFESLLRCKSCVGCVNER